MTIDERRTLARFNYIVALASFRGRDDWRSILAAIPQDAAAVAASKAEAGVR